MKNNIVASLAFLAETRGNDVAYQYFFEDDQPAKVLTYSQLDSNVRRIALQLSMYFKRGDRALLLYNSGFEFIEAFFACLYAGIIPVPAYPPKKNQNTDRLRAIILDAGATGALTSDKINEIARPLLEAEPTLSELPIITTDNFEQCSDEQTPWQHIDIQAQDLAFLQYTSGSTGSPKGVMVSHGNIMDNEQMMKVAFEHDSNSKIVSWLPHFHDMGLIFGIMHPIYIGAPATLMNPTYFLQKPLRWLKLLSDTKAVTSSAPNFAYDLCVDTIKDSELANLDLSHWRSALNGAEPVRASTLERFYQKFKQCGLRRNSISPCYGMAETTLFATGSKLLERTSVLSLDAQQIQSGNAVVLKQPQKEEAFVDDDGGYYAVSCGQSWQNHDVIIVNPENKQRCEDYAVGEIWVKGASVAQGYWQNEQATKETFRAYTACDNSGPFLRTGDLGFIANEQLYVTGRCKDVLIFNGKNYYPQDIELSASECHEALDSNGGAAFSIQTPSDEEGLVVVQQVKRTFVRKLNSEAIFSAINQAIVEQHGVMPYEVVLIKPGRILKTSSGKIQRQENKRHYLANEFEVLARSRDEVAVVDLDKESLQSDSKALYEQVVAAVKEHIAFEVDKKPEQLDVSASFVSFGVDSVKAVRISGELMEHFDIELGATVLYEYPSIAQLSAYLSQNDKVKRSFDQALIASGEINQSEHSLKQSADERDLEETADIAVIGMACRYPKAENIDAFWQLLIDKEDAISLPESVRKALCPSIESSRMGGYVKNIECFDAAMFSISPTEAKHIDPQHRLLLESSYHAIQSAGYQPSELSGNNIGVYVGISQNDYFLLSQQTKKENPYLGTGTALSIAANRLSYTYNFTGPSVAIDTACSSSLVALHQAVQAIRNDETNAALVAGVNLILSDEVTNACDNAQMLADDGHCKTFSDSANGYVRSEGIGCILLKPLSSALAEKDHIYGVIKGSAVNQDGRSNGITAPNGLSQQAVIKDAIQNAGITAADVQYVECHGTGTELGDPIEISALNKTYGQTKTKQSPLVLGAVKANIGHLESGAGIAGVIKTLLCMQHRQLPGQRYVEHLNTHVKWSQLPLSVLGQTQTWPKLNNEQMIAGVSSFGFGGTNAHVICAQTPTNYDYPKLNIEANKALYVLPLSAKNPDSMQALAASYAQSLAHKTDDEFDALIYNSVLKPQFSEYRSGYFGASRKELVQALKAGMQTPQKRGERKQTLVFAFTGQGAQYTKMGLSLYQTQGVFKSAIDECDRLLLPSFDGSLIDALFGENSQALLEQTKWTQVALFSLEYALGKLCLSLGLEPKVMVGHSVGEYAAACLAGVFSLEDALTLVSSRANLMHKLEASGSMVSARCDEQLAKQLVQNYKNEAAISAYHGRSGVVFSGSDHAISEICKALENHQVKYTQLNTAKAFHSPLMRPMLEQFAHIANSIKYNLPKIAFLSSVTGNIESKLITDAQYWIEQIIQPVEFAKVMDELKSIDDICVLELGPKPVLCALLQENISRSNDELLSLLTHKRTDNSCFANTLARLYELGFDINWQALYGKFDTPKTPMPLYPFAKTPYWITDAVTQTLQQIPAAISSSDRVEAIQGFVLNTLSKQLSISASDIHPTQPLLEMGVDSLMIMQAVRAYEKEFNLEFSVRQFYEELSTVEQLVEYIAAHSDYLLGQSEPVEAVSSIEQTSTVSHAQQSMLGSDFAQIFNAQLQAAASVTHEQARLSVDSVVAQQLRVMHSGSSQTMATAHSQVEPTHVAPSTFKQAATGKQTTSVLPGFQTKQVSAFHMSSQIAEHQAQLAKRFVAKTKSSKALVAEHRAHLADCRASAGFRLSSKEMLYPIYSKRCHGARIWDIDDNEYIDITMDFGVNLFGHKPEFITQALYEQVDAGLQLGLASTNACEAAKLVSELTALERVTFCNSGTEAVMTAVRLARSKTNRDKIVQFNGAYHGHYDGTLAHPSEQGVEPMCSGVRLGSVSDNLVLDYGDDAALDIIRANASTIAAVLVEPVQSRHPELQPWSFLHKLRELTQALDIALIFDEMITGFRAHPGGVQALLGIQADMATYGKIVGGGLPIGVVAGSAKYLDGIDGGVWQYGDASFPQADTTFFAGTFCKHPLVMATAKAVLSEIKHRGARLQASIEDKTTYLKDTLNDFFVNEQVPITIESFSSLFRFKFNQNLDVFFYEMLSRGVFIWEGRNCFLSDAHSREDVQLIIKAVKDSVLTLKKAGYFGTTTEPNHDVTEFPLTQSQQQLLALALSSEEGAKAYHLQATLKLDGQLDKAKLKNAIQQVHGQFSLLNCGIDTGNLTHQLVNVEHELCREFSITNTQDLMPLLDELRYLPFSFDNERLCRFSVVTVNDQEHYLTLVAHHVLYDGISLSLVLDAVANNYSLSSSTALEQGVAFGHYVSALEHYLASGGYLQDQAYWYEQLADCEQVLPPVVSAQISKDTFEVESVDMSLNDEVMANISTLAKQQGCGQFATMLALYMLWLNKLSQESIVSVAIPSSDRSLLNFMKSDGVDIGKLDTHLVGYCTNLLSIVVDFKTINSIGALIKRVQNTLLNAFEHQHYPYSQLVNSGQNTPSTLFNLDRVATLPSFDGLCTSSIASKARYGQFKFSLNVLTVQTHTTLQVEFNRCAYKPSQIQSYLDSLITLLTNLRSNDLIDSEACSLLSNTDRQMLVSQQLENTYEIQPQEKVSFISTFEQQTKANAEKIALVCEQQQLSYSSLSSKANRLAHYLIAKGIKEHDLVAIALPRRTDMLVALLAVMKAGAAFLPIDLAYPAERVTGILQDANATMVICDSTSNDSEILTHAPFKVLDIDNEALEIDAQNDDSPTVNVSSNHTAYAIYTSGSTGKPKGVEISHGNLLNLLNAMQHAPGIEVQDRLLAITTIAFDIAILELFLPLCVGATVILANEQECSDPSALIGVMQAQHISMMQATPTLWRLLLKTNSECVHDIKVLCGGEPLDKPLADTILSNGAELWNMYGPTETTIWSSVKQITDKETITIGEGISNTSLFVMPNNARQNSLPLPAGVWGELWIGGAGVAKGYINREELTSQRFIEHQFADSAHHLVYKTGDRARRLVSGEIEIQGRLDQQVKLNGHRIELGEIESQLTKLIGTQYVKALIVPVDNDARALSIYCLNDNQQKADWTLSHLRQALASFLPNYMLPEHVCWLDAWPTTANGKLNVRALPSIETEVNVESDVIAPCSETEQALLQCYLSVLNRSVLSTQISFFDAGGNSVLAMQLVSKINRTFGIRVTVADIFDYPNVIHLAQRIDDLNQAHMASGAPRVQHLSDIASGRDISDALNDQSMTEMDL